MAQRDYYEILGVDRSADEKQLKSSYRKLAKKYHPDLNPDDKEAEANFKEINEAYEVLSDTDKRARYDRFGHAGVNGQGGPGAGGGQGGFEDIFGDIFGDMFGGGFSGGRRQQRTGPRKGADLRYRITIEFEEAAFGVEKEIKITKNDSCHVCGGTGAKKGTKKRTCPTCHGTGTMQQVQNTPFGQFATQATCTTCRGTGSIIDDPCDNCHGGGIERKTQKLKIKIPAGVDNGSVIPLRGQGEPGTHGGPKGDLYVQLQVQPHKIFERDGDDLHLEYPINFVQAALGDEVNVPTLEGKVKYTIPEGTQTGTIFRLRGKGIQNVNGRGKGNLYVHVHIEVPKRLSKQQKEALRNFGDLTDDSVYDKKKGFFEKLKEAFE
ncbi:molecular chaperone DnaJ [Gottschalkiaceae bacterium SANA]|nr:molecular chaperone DnaJ [Gottschalkiaceae bacterium SANA]